MRLRLLHRGSADHGFVYRTLYTCPKVMTTIRPPLTDEAADAAFERICRHNACGLPGHRYWALERRSNGAPIGISGFRRKGDRGEMGILLVADAWRQGFGGETFSALIPHAFDGIGLAHIDVERADDERAAVLWRLLAPYGFHRVPASEPTRVRWTLSHSAWIHRRGGVGIERAVP
ncbi:GNAT family N-acetyltransferase [Cognatilysobacter bugurensis]|uniref:N-acetyltransferase domain-containing protein n=1 Tax=Cognatilysobacter bugurensis TaxID=543356 RepID=A0A918T3Q5_9GAMM|nr:GNAT family N-acetyltransferase [Lysobacter bugurensis]GHA88140.1 hypothetical protein GCM10007067_27720 [Lysobacter bugurensis]